MTCCIDTKPTNSIILTQGDDSNAFGNTITINVSSDLDMSGWHAILQMENFQWRYDDITNGSFEWVLSRDITSQLGIGLQYAAIKIFDANNLCRTVVNNIPVYVNAQVVNNPGVSE